MVWERLETPPKVALRRELPGRALMERYESLYTQEATSSAWEIGVLIRSVVKLFDFVFRCRVHYTVERKFHGRKFYSFASRKRFRFIGDRNVDAEKIILIPKLVGLMFQTS